MTNPVRPPADIRLRCVTHQEEEFNHWTGAWNHQLEMHGGVSPMWELLGTLPE